MPHATKDAPARPFDIDEAIARAAHCRAARERAGLNLEGLAALAGVTVRSVSRWESPDGRGSCPDDVLDALEKLLDRQSELTAAAVARAVGAVLQVGGGARADRGGGACKPEGYAEGGRPKPDLNQGGPDGPDPMPAEADSMPWGSRFDAGEGGSMPWDGRFDAMGATVRLLYYPTQRCYEECVGKGYYGVANANARAIAQELERLGFEIEWRFATPELVADFEYEYT